MKKTTLKMRPTSLIILILFFACQRICAEKQSVNNGFTVSGYVKDAENGEMLIGATVVIDGTTKGTVTNEYGFFSISTGEEDDTLEISYLGYESQKTQVDGSARITIELEPVTQTMEEVTVTGGREVGSSRFPMLGVETMASSSINQIPVLMGETDPMKALQMLPGVSATSEGSSNFTVRGGNPDQNLLLMDEAIVYNAGHLLGFFSVFNNEAIKNIQLYKRDFPASKGGRLSSVLDVKTRKKNMKKFSGSAGLGLISSKATFEGPIVKNKASFLVSGRRTYLDVFLPLAPEEDIRENKLYFYDTNIKVNWIAGDKDRFFLSGYLGRDVFGDNRAHLDFGNNTISFRWNHLFSSSMFANFTLVNSRYDYFLGTSDIDIEDMEWYSEFIDYMLSSDFSWFISPRQTLRFGWQSIFHQIDPGLVSGPAENSLFREVQLPRSNSLEHGLYVSHTGELNHWLNLRLGLRYSLFQNIGPGKQFFYDENYKVSDTITYKRGDVYNTYYGLEPRAGISASFTPRLSAKLSYSRTRQYFQLASNSTSSTPLDVWFPSSPNIKPQMADQVSFGLFKTSRDRVLKYSVEVFNKWMENTIDFKDHPDLILNETIEGEVRTGMAWARGLELMLRWNTTRFDGWIGYTLSKSERVAAEINNEEPYLSPYDHTHNFSVYTNYLLSPRVSLSGNWVYYTGSPITMPVGRFEINGEIIPLYSERNAERMPDYHRLDLSVTLHSRKNKNKGGEWVFSLYNAYGRKNAWAINFLNEEGSPFDIKAEKTYLFSVVPSISYKIEF